MVTASAMASTPFTVTRTVSHERENSHGGGVAESEAKASPRPSPETENLVGVPFSDTRAENARLRRLAPACVADAMRFVGEAMNHAPSSHPTQSDSSPGSSTPSPPRDIPNATSSALEGVA